MKILFTFIFLLWCGIASATNRYVDGTLSADCSGSTYSIASRNCSGSDGPGYKLAQSAADAVAAGDVVLFRTGTYRASAGNSTLVTNISGASGNPITYKPYNGEAVTIDCATVNAAASEAGIFLNSQWNIIGDTTLGKGFHIGGSIGSTVPSNFSRCIKGVVVTAHNNKIFYNDISYTWLDGVNADGFSNVEVAFNRIHDTNQVNYPRGAVYAGFPHAGQTWGAGASDQGGGSGFFVHDNFFYYNHGESIAAGLQHRGYTFLHNVVADPWAAAINMTGGRNDGLLINGLVDSNFIYLTNAGLHSLHGTITAQSDQNTKNLAVNFTAEPEGGGTFGTIAGLTIQNNICFECLVGVLGFTETTWPHGDWSQISILNNTFVSNSANYFASIQLDNNSSDGGGKISGNIQNNISTGFPATDVLGQGYFQAIVRSTTTNPTVTASNNIWNTPAGMTCPFLWGTISNQNCRTLVQLGWDTASNQNSPSLANEAPTLPRLWADANLGPADVDVSSMSVTTFMATYTAGFVPAGGSPAIDTGATIASITTDILGNARAAPYDMGAIEVGASPPGTSTIFWAASNPTNVSLTVLGCAGSGCQTTGTTPWNAFYTNGSVLSATAPATAPGGNSFLKWQQDGVDFSTNANITPTVSINRTYTMVFGASPPTTHTLTVSSANPNSAAHITISPNDNQNRNSGSTQFTRVYNTGSAVTLIARSTANAPLMWLKLEEGSGTSAADSSNDGLNGTLTNGATWVAGLGSSAHAVSLNGTNQYILVPNAIQFSGIPGLTLGIKLKPSQSLVGVTAALIVKNTDAYWLYAAHPACNDKPYFGFQDIQGNFHSICGNTAMTSGVEADLRGTFDGGTLNIYLNGVSDATPVTTGAVIVASSGALQIGASTYGEFFPGVVDNVQVYDSAVAVDAPGNAFQSWSGCDSATTFTCNVTLSADKSVTANYITGGSQFTITVNTVNPTNVTGMSVDTIDINGSPTTNLTAPFTRTYIGGPYITVSAPLTSGSNTFVAWAGCDATNIGSVAACHVFATSNRTVTATYSSPTVRALTLVSVNPTSGVAITGITADLSSQTSCTTPNCALTYNDSTSVVATAPATVGSNTFSAWTGCTSVSGTGNRTCNMTMNADKVGTVTYTTPPAACITGVKASVTITVKGNALIANCNGG